MYMYTLMTICLWKNGKIKEFRIRIRSTADALTNHTQTIASIHKPETYVINNQITERFSKTEIRNFTSPQDITALYIGFIRFNFHNLQSNFSTKHLSDYSKLKAITKYYTLVS